ncbi:MAG TPA: MFS transporter [Candidatus Paceibacterota bacterium]
MKQSLRSLVYIGGFFFTLHIAFASYINSSFIAQIIGDKFVGLFFIIASIGTVLALSLTPLFIRNFGFKLGFLSLLLVNLLLTIFITLDNNKSLVVLTALFFFYIIGLVLKYILDLFLETLSSDENTGGIRGTFLSTTNLGWVLVPILLGSVLGSGSDYSLIYLLSGLAILPFTIIVLLIFKNKLPTIKETKKSTSIIKSFYTIISSTKNTDKNLKHILIIDFLLNFFYAFMVIYTPIYLHTYIGLPWIDIGLIFTIMLLPFVLLQYPLGQLADRLWGEKEIIILGLLITGLSTIAVSFIDTNSLIVWTIILFITRIGAASIEIGKETFLFKHINSNDSNLLSLSRIMLPLAYIAGPACATIIIYLGSIQLLFIFLGLIMILGLYSARLLVDTK